MTVSKADLSRLFGISTCVSLMMVGGEIVESVAVLLTLDSRFIVPAISLLGVVGVLGSLWACSSACVHGSKLESVENQILPAVILGQVLYVGVVTIATVQNVNNVFLLLPEVPLDIIEERVANRIAREQPQQDNGSVGSSNSSTSYSSPA